MYQYKRRNRQRDDQHLDRWLISYADYMTLMFALFVVLYAMALAREGSLEQLTRRLGDLFHAQHTVVAEPNPSDGIMQQASDDMLYGHGLKPEGGPDLVDGRSELVNFNKRHQGSALSNLEQEFNEALLELINSGFADIQRDEDWLVLTLSSSLLFASGSAAPSANLRAIIPSVAKVLASSDNYIRVRGYTDSSPINNEIFSSNWELSSARAAEVLEQMILQGVRPDLLAVEAFGANFPLSPNDTAQGRAENRRVDIAVSKWGKPEGTDEPLSDGQATDDNESSEPLPDYDEVQVIELPSGGIRITTRRESSEQGEPQP
ncbi:cell envelope biogenesis protein OmpA [Neiella marina]|uniref:Cell envelope biogenesis protein OmpA n=1 Tax=Neiella marina TaxID=508461 RepID=A0A8J2XMG0_9GAMM|nr:OmpA family protein [Neiella marina]GGA78226.1 cell envelope biogenesis protein OmpA [Neiella marina]